MTPPWGINWQCYHKDQQDMPHVEKMGYRSFTTYEWMWSDRGFCNELLAVARGDAIFLNRDHPKSEEKDDLWESDPAQKGRNHADDWAQKVREGHVFTPLDRTYFLGLNEPNSNEFQRQIDAYNEAYCRRMAEHGLRAAAYSFGVGHPSTVGLRQDTPPDWHWYAASAAAVLEGHHLAAFHEYGAPDDYGWDFWCNRSRFCPYAFDVVLDECGIDHGVVDGQLYGWAKYLTPEQYMAWLDGFQVGMAERAPTRTVKLLAYNIFSFDHGRGETKDWHSFDIRPLRPLLETHQWSQPKIAAAPPVQTHLPTVGTGPKPVAPPSQPQPTQPPAPVPILTHPIQDPAKRIISQRFGDNPADYARFGLAGHAGLDFAVPVGTPVVAVDAGVVQEAGELPDYGTYIKLRHPWGESVYAHLSKLHVTPGEFVAAGTVIGLSGYSGNVDPPGPAGAHLHFALRIYPYTRGAPFDGFTDPAPYLINTPPRPAQPTPPVTSHREIVADIRAAAREFGVDPDLLLSLAWAESSFDPRVRSDAGAQGLFQIMPATWDEWGPKVGASDPYAVRDSARVGAAYMRWLIGQVGGNVSKALYAYVFGIGNVLGGVAIPEEAYDYADRIAHGRDLLKAVRA